jgi:hypothetical protein
MFSKSILVSVVAILALSMQAHALPILSPGGSIDIVARALDNVDRSFDSAALIAREELVQRRVAARNNDKKVVEDKVTNTKTVDDRKNEKVIVDKKVTNTKTIEDSRREKDIIDKKVIQTKTIEDKKNEKIIIDKKVVEEKKIEEDGRNKKVVETKKVTENVVKEKDDNRNDRNNDDRKGDNKRRASIAGTRAAHHLLRELEVRGEEVFENTKRGVLGWIWA